jgi:hypothetical protein
MTLEQVIEEMWPTYQMHGPNWHNPRRERVVEVLRHHRLCGYAPITEKVRKINEMIDSGEMARKIARESLKP